MNNYPDPKTDAESMAIHAVRLSEKSDKERTAYLSEFSGQRTPAPVLGYKEGERGKSLADLLGADGVAALLAQADALKAAVTP